MSEAAPVSRSPIWQRHRGLLVAAVVLVVLLITAITDLAGCALAVHQAIGIWDLQAAHKLTTAERAPTPGLLSDDQTACSFTNEDIFDLTGIQVPGTPAGKQLGQMVATATLWTTSDALRAIEDVQTLMSDPTSATTARSLAKAERQMAADRRTALSQEGAADKDLATHLTTVDLPSVQTGSSG